jgi:hypothetical protein
MKFATILAAALIAGSSTIALAQTGGGGAGSDVSTPRKNVQRPTANSPAVSRRGDDMPAGMNQVPMNNSMGMGMQGEGKKMGMHKGKKMKHHAMKKSDSKKKEM